MPMAHCLKLDHDVLRVTLDMVNGMLSLGPEKWPLLREGYLILRKRLRRHMQRESLMVAMLQEDSEAAVPAHMGRCHRKNVQALQELGGYFQESTHADNQLYKSFSGLIGELNTELELQEERLFPLIHSLCESRDTEPQGTTGNLEVSESTVTINDLVSLYPQTTEALMDMSIYPEYVGLDTLKEVAGRRCMESKQILKNLENAVGHRIRKNPVAFQMHTPRKAGRAYIHPERMVASAVMQWS